MTGESDDFSEDSPENEPSESVKPQKSGTNADDETHSRYAPLRRAIRKADTEDSDALVAIRTYYEAIDTHDYELLGSVLDPEFVQHRPDMTLEGSNRFVEFMRTGRPATDTTHPIEAVYVNPAEIAVRGQLVGNDGEEITAFVDVFSLEGNKIAEIVTYTK